MIRAALESSRPLIDSAGHSLSWICRGRRSGSTRIRPGSRRSSAISSTTPPNIRRTAAASAVSLARHGDEAQSSPSPTAARHSREKHARRCSVVRPGRPAISIARAAASASGWRWSNSSSRCTAVGRGEQRRPRRGQHIHRPDAAGRRARRTGRASNTLQSPAPVSQALKVLVVDDNEAVAQTVGWMLEEIGHDYRLVYDGR